MTATTNGDIMQRYDHPARLLRETKTAGPTARAAFDISAKVLEEYEKDKGVTFEALDTETLAQLKEAYAAIGKRDGSYGDLADIVRDLFGLED